MPLLNGAGAVYSVQVALVKLNLDDGILDLARDYAAQSGLSLDELVCALIHRVVAP